MNPDYVPQKGDLVWLNFQPQAGHEQAGRRPALVLTPEAYNRKVGLAVFCPVTGQVKGYPFEVLLPEGIPIQGAVLVDQVKSLDWRTRQAEFICRLEEIPFREVTGKLSALLGLG